MDGHKKANIKEALGEFRQHLSTLSYNPEQRESLILTASLAFNLIYAAFKLIVGGWYHSWWMISLGIYYGLLAVMRFHLVRKLEKENGAADWQAYRHTAILLLVLTVIIGGIVELTFSLEQTFVYPGVLVYAFAAFAFGKIISVSIALVKKRREENRVLAAARCVSFAHALLSILALQVALIHQFGADHPSFARIMNSAMGGVSCSLIAFMAIWMLVKSEKAMKK